MAGGEERQGESSREGQHEQKQILEGGMVRKAYFQQICLSILSSPPHPQAAFWCPWLNGLPHRWWSCSRPWPRRTRPWASWSRASASWRRPPSTAPSYGRSPMSPGAATSRPVAGLSASSLQVPAPPWGTDQQGEAGSPGPRKQAGTAAQLCDCHAVTAEATLGLWRRQAPRPATWSSGCLNRARLLPP